MNKQQRINNRNTAASLQAFVKKPYHCPHCGELTKHGHFFPPCFGEEGFYICKEKKDD